MPALLPKASQLTRGQRTTLESRLRQSRRLGNWLARIPKYALGFGHWSFTPDVLLTSRARRFQHVPPLSRHTAIGAAVGCLRRHVDRCLRREEQRHVGRIADSGRFDARSIGLEPCPWQHIFYYEFDSSGAIACCPRSPGSKKWGNRPPYGRALASGVRCETKNGQSAPLELECRVNLRTDQPRKRVGAGPLAHGGPGAASGERRAERNSSAHALQIADPCDTTPSWVSTRPPVQIQRPAWCKNRVHICQSRFVCSLCWS